METPKKGRSKLLWGCGGGCVSFLVILAIFAWGVRWWMMRPLPIADPEIYTGPNTKAVLILEARPGDALLLSILAEMADTDVAQKALAPGGARTEGLMKAEAMAGIAPVQIVGVLGVPDAGENSAALVISITRGGRAFVQSTASYYGRPHADAPTIYGPARGPYAVIRGNTNTVMLVNRRDGAESLSERFGQRFSKIAGEEQGTEISQTGIQPEALAQRLEELENAPVRSAAVGADAVMAVASKLASAAGQQKGPLIREALAGVTALSASLVARDETSGVLTLHLQGAGPEATGGAAKAALEAFGAASVRVVRQEEGSVTVEAILPELPREAARALRALAGE
jgi:hypothetical protein